MQRSKFRSIIKSIVEEIIEEDELEEATTTGDVEGYSTPFAFDDSGKSKKKKKRIATNSTGYKPVEESLDNNDIMKVKKIIRFEVGNILRDIWLKRNAWNK